MSDETLTDEVAEARALKLAELAQSPGAAAVVTEDQVQTSYFGATEIHLVVLPDGISTFQHRTFTEGMRRKYLNASNNDLVVNRHSGDAKIKTSPGDTRAALLKVAVCGWNLLDPKGATLPFNPSNLDKVLNEFPPHILELVEKDVIDKNPWLNADVTVEDIDAEIEALQEQRAALVKRDEGKASS